MSGKSMPEAYRVRRQARAARALCHLLAAAALALAPPLRAAPTDLSDVPLENLLNVEVYAASRFAQRINDAPANVTVITAAEIKQFGWRTLAEILRSVTGVDVRYDRIYEYVGVRGFSRSGDYNTGLTVLIDGYRVNDNVYDSGFIGAELGLDVDLIEKVEVVRGPASALYGGNAVLGVVNVITRSASDVGGVELAARAGSFGLLQGRASFGKALENGAQVLLSATSWHADGPNLYVPEFDQPENKFGRTRGTDYESGRNFFGKFSFGSLTVTAAGSERTKGNATGYYGAAFDDPANNLRDSNAYLNAVYYRDLSPDTELGLRAYLGDYSYVGRYVIDVPPRVLNDDSADGTWWGAEARILRKLAGGGKWVFGAEYQRNLRQDQTNYYADLFGPQSDSRYQSSHVGVFVDGQVPLSDRLILSAALRLDRYSGFDNQWSPRVAAIYKPSATTVLKLLYGSGFRIPSAFERFYSFPGEQLPNPALSPESASNLEAVFEHYLTPRTRVLATAYCYRVGGVLMQVNDEASGAFQFRNGPAAVGRGLELELEHLWQNGARLRASAFGADVDNSDGTLRPLALERQAKLNLSLPLPGVPLSLGVEGLWNGARTAVAGEVGGFGVLNLSLLYPSDKRGLEASFSVFNLFNKKYADAVAFEPALPTRSGIEQDGRSARFMLQYRF